MNGGAAPHGGRLGEARRHHPDAPTPWLDLSTGINPVPYPLPKLQPDTYARLPEPEDVAALEAAAARAYGAADPAMVVAAPGTQALIGLIPHLFRARQVAVVGPTYNEHARSWRAAGAAVRDITDPSLATNAEALVLCNPNNPDGRRLLPEDLLRLARRRKLLLVDEAFADLEDPPLSLAPHLPHPSVVVLRSFGKTYGLAGLRLGFALATPERAAALRAALGPWAVSGPAIAIASVALADAAWLFATRARLTEAAARLDALLIAAGLRVLGGTRLFRLAEHADAPTLAAQLAHAGILVRSFPEHPRRLRFGLPPPDAAAWQRLGAALGVRQAVPTSPRANSPASKGRRSAACSPTPT